MRLKEYDWDAQNFVEVEYVDPAIADFINFFRTTKAWIQDAERVHRAVMKLNKALAAEHQAQREARAATAANMTGEKPTLEDVLAAARNPSAPEWLKMCAAEITSLRTALIGDKPKPKKGGHRAAHAEG